MCPSHRASSSATAPAAERDGAFARAAARRGSAIAPSEAKAARSFYRDVLKGRQVWPTGRAEAGGSLWFLVGRTLVEVGPDLQRAAAPIVVDVDDPDRLAARAWDAGYHVRVHEDATGRAPVSVVDPFGRQIHLASDESSADAVGARVTAGEEER